MNDRNTYTVAMTVTRGGVTLTRDVECDPRVGDDRYRLASAVKELLAALHDAGLTDAE